MKIKNIYLAAPFFTKEEIEVYKETVTYLRRAGYNVYVPREHPIPDGWLMENKLWGKKVFDNDVQAIKKCDTVVTLMWGMYSDAGTAWEQGYAYALGKNIIQVIVDTNGRNNREQDISLMTQNGCTRVMKLSDLLRQKSRIKTINQK